MFKVFVLAKDLPNCVLSEFDEIIPSEKNGDGEWIDTFTRDDNILNMIAICELCEDFQHKVLSHTDYNLRKAIAQAHIEMIKSYLKDS